MRTVSKGGSLACVHTTRRKSIVAENRAEREESKSPLPKTRSLARARLRARTGPQTPRWRPPAAGDCAAQPRTGTRRAALLGPCARAAPLGAIRPRGRGCYPGELGQLPPTLESVNSSGEEKTPTLDTLTQ